MKEQSMTVGIVGLGLMGGSFAKAYCEAGHRVLAYNRSSATLDAAIISGIAEGELNEETIGQCDLIIIALYPRATIEYLQRMAKHIQPHTVVVDTCGIKRQVCDACFPIAEANGFTFVGGHPMAGTQFSGFKYSRASMYKDAAMILVPPENAEPMLLANVEKMLAPCRFGRMTVTTAENHDRMIAFSSQMAHVVSNAFVKSPSARQHKGYSAGSYKDMTRVAWLNPEMWTELFMDNADFLTEEIDTIIANITEYRDAIKAGDRGKLRELLAEGRDRKEEIDGR